MLLEQRILDLQKDKGALIDKVRALKNEVTRLTNENKILKQGKTNVFTELNDEQQEKAYDFQKRAMKEVTYEDWQKNSTPRMMWVWDISENNKKQRKVIYLLNPKLTYPVVALSENETAAESFTHCAEIEEPKTRRMTNKELSRWLREKPTRERIWTFDGCICSIHNYNEKCESEEVRKGIRIREDDGEWREPLVEVEE